METDNPNKGKIAGYFQKAIEKANALLNDQEKLQQLMSSAREKVQKLRDDNEQFDQLIHHIGTAMRMVKAYKNKSYTDLPWKSILTLTAGIVYFVFPLDLIPDFIPVAGFLDDAGVMFWVFNALRKDIEAFEDWEKTSSDI